MRTRNLEISFRKGRPIAAYLYLGQSEGRSIAAKSTEVEPGLVVDCSEGGAALGIEIIHPRRISTDHIDELLVGLGEPKLEETEVDALVTMRDVEKKDHTENGKDLFAWYGSATSRAQLFEQELIIVLILSARLENRSLTPEEVGQIDADLSRQTLGSLLRELKRKIEVDEGLGELWSQALSKRI